MSSIASCVRSWWLQHGAMLPVARTSGDTDMPRRYYSIELSLEASGANRSAAYITSSLLELGSFLAPVAFMRRLAICSLTWRYAAIRATRCRCVGGGKAIGVVSDSWPVWVSQRRRSGLSHLHDGPIDQLGSH